jgi:hypothetical protein
MRFRPHVRIACVLLAALAPGALAAETPSPPDSLRTPDSFVAPYRFLRTATNIIVVNQAIWAYNRYFRSGVDNEQFSVGWRDITDNITDGYEWDDNSFWVNHMYHPVQGSLHHVAGRANGYGFWASGAWSVAGSWMWEHLSEKNPPSPNDFVNSSVGGMALGETVFRLSTIVLDNRSRGPERFWREIGGLVLAPSRGLNRLVSGEAYRVHQNPADRMPSAARAELRPGFRSLEPDDAIHSTSENAMFQFVCRYGDPFSTSGRGPFRHFDFEFLYNVGDSDYPIGRLDVAGLLAGTVLEDDRGGQHLLACVQHLEYLNNDAWEFGTQSVSATYRGGFVVNRVRLLPTVRLKGILLAATRTDYHSYKTRTYDYGMGGGYEASLAVGDRAGREFVTISRTESFVRTIDGTDSNHRVRFTRVGVWLPVGGPMAVGADFERYEADRFYRDFANVASRSDEFRLFASWVID